MTATIAIAAVGLAESARHAKRHTVSDTEERLFRLVNGGPDAVELPLWMVMQSGSLAAVFAVAGVQKRRRENQTAVASLVAGVAVWGGIKALKPLIGRGRPERHLQGVSVRGQPQTGLGYPSGHAAVATTLSLIVGNRSTRLKKAAALIVAGVTGGARMYTGAHLPLDVVGGTAIGVLCGRATTAALNSANVWPTR